MKRYFNTLLDVFERVINFCLDSDNVTITNSIPALQTAVTTTLTGKVDAINALIYAQSQKNQGYAVQKRSYKQVAANLAMIVLSGAKALAKATNDQPLLAQVKYSYWTLYKTRDGQFSNVVNGLMTLLTPYQTPLADYGIAVADFTAVTDATALFDTVLVAPRSQIQAKEAINLLLDGMFTDTNDFVRTIIDPIVQTLKSTEEEYYLGYRAARKLVPHGLRHNRINATVLDELNEPIIGVQVTVDQYTDPDTGKTYRAVTGNTDINGMVTVEDFWPGNRTVTISGDSVITKTFGPFLFKHGSGLTQNFTCQPAFANLPAPQPEVQKEKVIK